MRTSFSRRLALPIAITSVVALVVALAWVALSPQRATAQQSVTVQMVDFAFNPGTITVEVGTTVTWVNQGAVPHTATGNNGEFDTGQLEPGQSGSVTFDTPGTFNYFCQIHPNMTGSIVVVAADDAGADDMAADDVEAADDSATGGTTQAPSTGTGIRAGTTGSAQLALAAFGSLILALGVAVRRRTI